MKTEILWVGDRLGIMPTPAGGEQLEDQMRELKSQGVDVVVCLLEPAEQRSLGLQGEGRVAEDVGLDFFHHPIEERGTPASKREFNALVEEVLPRMRGGERIVIHGRRGRGRSVILAASLMALTGYPVGLTFQRIGEASGQPVPDTAEQRLWVSEFISFLTSEASER